MSRPRITLIDATLGNDTHAQRNFQREIDADLSIYKVSEGNFPPPESNAEHDAVIISGSQASVYEWRPWMKRLAHWTEDLIAVDKPVLGVCWGHQFLAEVLGGTVRDMGEYELGYHQFKLVENDPVFGDIDRRFTAFATHSDAVTELPAGATELATNATCNQAFRHENVVGVQFHPEYDLQSARYMIQVKDLSEERIESILADTTEMQYARAKPTKVLFDNFVETVRS